MGILLKKIIVSFASIIVLGHAIYMHSHYSLIGKANINHGELIHFDLLTSLIKFNPGVGHLTNFFQDNNQGKLMSPAISDCSLHFINTEKLMISALEVYYSGLIHYKYELFDGIMTSHLLRAPPEVC